MIEAVVAAGITRVTAVLTLEGCVTSDCALISTPSSPIRQQFHQLADRGNRGRSSLPAWRVCGMIAEILLVLAGHTSSLFPADHTLHPTFSPLLHPGEQQCLESLGSIAFRYRKIKASCAVLSHSPSRFVCALSATLNHILKNEYESLVIETEAKVLRRDPILVASGSFVPLSSVRAIFSEWDAPLAALVSLVEDLESEEHWRPGPLIDMLLTRSQTGVYRIADILSRLSVAVQCVWRTHLIAFLVHGSLSVVDPLTSNDYTLLEGSMPTCISVQSRESIAYIGRAIGTVKAAKWQKQLPRSVASTHTALLETVLPEDQHAFDLAISQIRTNVSEWLWLNVLTQADVEDAVDSLYALFCPHQVCASSRII